MNLKTPIFLSYSTNDKKKLEILTKLISEISYFEPVIAPDARTTNYLPEKVKSGILRSQVFIVIFTKNSEYNKWVNQEIGIAYALEKPIYTIIDENLLGNQHTIINNITDHPYRFVDYETSSVEKKITPIKSLNSFKLEVKKLISDLALEYDKINLRFISDEFKEKIQNSRVFSIDKSKKRWLNIENIAFYINDEAAWNYITQDLGLNFKTHTYGSQEYLESLKKERALTFR